MNPNNTGLFDTLMNKVMFTKSVRNGIMVDIVWFCQANFFMVMVI